MPVRTPQDLSQSLKQNKIQPVYFLFGPESYLRDEAAKAIAEAALRDTPLREFNESVFRLNSTAARAAIAAAEQLPMMSMQRVVIIKDFAKLSEADEAVLLSYLERPVESAAVIFVTEDLDKRKKLAKTLMATFAVEFLPLRNNELATWARAHLKKLKAEIDPHALQSLIEEVAADVGTLANELNKLATAALPGTQITSAMVEALAIKSREHQNFELTDQITSGNRKAAIRTLCRLLDDGSEPLMLVGLIGSTYRRLAMANALLARGATSQEIFSQVRMPPFKQSSYLATVRGMDHVRLAHQMARIADADLAIKTSQATPRMQVELLVTELTGTNTMHKAKRPRIKK